MSEAEFTNIKFREEIAIYNRTIEEHMQGDEGAALNT